MKPKATEVTTQNGIVSRVVIIYGLDIFILYWEDDRFVEKGRGDIEGKRGDEKTDKIPPPVLRMAYAIYNSRIRARG